MASTIRREEATTLVQRLKESLGAGGGQHAAGGKRVPKNLSETPNYGNRSVHLRHGTIGGDQSGNGDPFPSPGGHKTSMRVKSSEAGRDDEEGYKTTQVIDVDTVPPVQKSLMQDTVNGKWKPNLGLGRVGLPGFLLNDSDTLEDLDSLKSPPQFRRQSINTGGGGGPPSSNVYQTLMSLNLGGQGDKIEHESLQQRRRFSTNLPTSVPLGIEPGTKRPMTQKSSSPLSSASSDSKLTIDDDTQALHKGSPSRSGKNRTLAWKAGLPWFLFGLCIGILILLIFTVVNGKKGGCEPQISVSSELYQPNHQNSTTKGRFRSGTGGRATSLETVLKECQMEFDECRKNAQYSNPLDETSRTQNGTHVEQKEELDDNSLGKDEDYDSLPGHNATGDLTGSEVTPSPPQEKNETGSSIDDFSNSTDVSEAPTTEGSNNDSSVASVMENENPGATSNSNEDSTTKFQAESPTLTTEEAGNSGNGNNRSTGTDENDSETGGSTASENFQSSTTAQNLETSTVAENLHTSNTVSEENVEAEETSENPARDESPSTLETEKFEFSTTLSPNFAEGHNNQQYTNETNDEGLTSEPRTPATAENSQDGSDGETTTGEEGDRAPTMAEGPNPPSTTMDPDLAESESNQHTQMSGRISPGTTSGASDGGLATGDPTPTTLENGQLRYSTTTGPNPSESANIEYTEANGEGTSESPTLAIENLRKPTTTENPSSDNEETTLGDNEVTASVTTDMLHTTSTETGNLADEDDSAQHINRETTESEMMPQTSETVPEEQESTTVTPGRGSGNLKMGSTRSPKTKAPGNKDPENWRGNYEAKPTSGTTFPGSSVHGSGGNPPRSGTRTPRSGVEPPPTDSGGNGSGGGRRRKQKGWFQRFIEVVKDVISSVTPFQVKSRDDGNLDIAVH